MAEEVSIRIGEFNSNLSKLQSGISSIDSSIATDREFEETNIKPFTESVEATIQAIELLERYKQMLNTDANALDNVGEEMVENDEQLAKVAGSQPIQA